MTRSTSLCGIVHTSMIRNLVQNDRLKMNRFRFHLKSVLLAIVGLNIFCFFIYVSMFRGSAPSQFQFAGDLYHDFEKLSESNDHVVEMNKAVKRKTPTEQKPFLHKVLAKSKECPHLSEPGHFPEQQRWQPYKPNDHTTYVFSAYYDDRPNPKVIRLIGISRSQISGYCQLWYEGSHDPMKITKLTSISLPEGHGHVYNSFFFVCPLPDGDDVPYVVSLVPNRCDRPANKINILNREKVKYDHLSGFAVCAAPLNFNYKRVDQIIENLEVNMMFGANHFTFYNNTLGDSVAEVLFDYVGRGIVDLVKWHLPVVVDKWPERVNVEIHYFAQIACLNDCLYRNMKKHKYIVTTDLDEFAVPRNHKNWPELINDIVKKGSNPASLMFRNTFFKTEWDDDETTGANKTLKKLNVESILKTRREPKIHAPNARSKNIVRASQILTLGVHNIWSYMSGGSSYVLTEKEGLLHHYRNWETKGDTNFVKDAYMLNFTDEIVARILKLKKRLQLWK